MRVLTRGGLVAAALLLGLAASIPAAAHAELRASDPADGAVLDRPPARLALTFTAPVQVTALRLLDEAGREHPLAREGAPRPGRRAQRRDPAPPAPRRLPRRVPRRLGRRPCRRRDAALPHLRARPVIPTALQTGEIGWAGVAVALRAAAYGGRRTVCPKSHDRGVILRRLPH